MHPNTISKWFSKFLVDNNLKKITFHQLRHTSASVLLQEGINVREVSKRLGHSNTSTTWNIYSHVLKSADQGASDVMEKVMFKNAEIAKKNQA
jgi:integrase